ncbi:putative bifunctional diguanylate cyclase/phosphodiesterase [Colwellia sp. TT2012]|uniref:putative bifunctional diguanylate cyclase/phosphodiesterase n=1 Tax=Colwellia sp. TT2012 TaxID=1720342 RepID=UPI00070F89FF|nr:EAL domain-containing protein [Colwellia sp. TT2012]
MLYIESKRLGRSTATGLLSIAIIILLQGLFGAWKMEQLTDDLSKSLVVFSDTQVEALTLKGMLINLRKLEKDILLYNQSPEEEKRVLSRWQKAQSETKQQFIIMELELQQSEVHEGESIAALATAFHEYSAGISRVVKTMSTNTGMTQYQALQAMAEYKQHIYTMEASIDVIVEAAEEQEVHAIESLELKKWSLFLTLGIFGTASLIMSIVLSIWIIRKNMHISRTLEHQALHDTLTGILNRRGLAVAMTEQVASGVLAYLDFDRFKLVNDLCGHTVGDELLIDLTKKMALLCYQCNCTLARVGGDEFVIWFSNSSVEHAQNISEQLVALVEYHPFEWMGQRMPLGASVGLAVGKLNFLFTELISRADAACRIAKIPGNAKVLVYEESDPVLMEIRREERWAAKIPQMIINQKFCLYGQSIVPLQSKEAIGHIEILIRGIDENGQIIPPGLFLPAAERFGLMPKIDRWVIETLLATNLDENVHYSVNMSAHTLADKAYLPKLVKLITESGKGHQLIFEITESAAMTSIETAQEYIRTLKAIGCRFSLDDFGSGFSSFAYLRDLQVDYLKIDGSLIKVLGRNPSDAALVQAIVNMAASLNLQTIAEYVETPEIAHLLYDMKVDFGQGYGLHKPEPLTKLKTFMSIKYDRALNV